jgi:hypothetical protein
MQARYEITGFRSHIEVTPSPALKNSLRAKIPLEGGQCSVLPHPESNRTTSRFSAASFSFVLGVEERERLMVSGKKPRIL